MVIQKNSQANLFSQKNLNFYISTFKNNYLLFIDFIFLVAYFLS